MADQTGALIPGAKVTVATADGKTVGTAAADASGAYSVSGLTAGSYIVQAEYHRVRAVSIAGDSGRGGTDQARGHFHGD